MILTTEQLLEEFRSIVRAEIKEALKTKEIKLYTREETCGVFRITKSTYHEWVKIGKIKPSKVNGKVVVHEDEINRVLVVNKGG